jgi:predicted metallopeptidase
MANLHLDRTGIRYPLILRWSALAEPLPVREVHIARARCATLPASGQPWHETGPAHEPLDFSGHMSKLLADIVARTPEFARIDARRVLVTATQARTGRRHGLQARVTPLRFPNGQVVRQRRGVAYQVQRYFLDDHEFYYLMTFCLPRFLDQDFDDKMITLFHELHHIHPEFNGDLRRLAGRCQYHSSSKKGYDRHMAQLARAYLCTRPAPQLHAFLRLNFQQLRERHRVITAIVVPRPKLIPLPGLQVAAARRE